MTATNTVIGIGAVKDAPTVDLALAQVAADFLSAKHRMEALASWAQHFNNDPAALVQAGWTEEKATEQLAAVAAGVTALGSLTSDTEFTKYLSAAQKVI